MPETRKQRVPSYRLHKPSGLAVVRLNGRDIYLGKHGSPESQVEYQRIIGEWLTNQVHVRSCRHAGETSPAPDDLTVSELVVAYWSFVEQYYVKDGQATDEQVCIRSSLRPLVELYGTRPVNHFGPLALEAVRQRMIDRDLSRKLINSRVNRIRRMFKWGFSKQLVPPDVLHALQSVAPLKQGRCNVREAPPVKPVPEPHVEAVLTHVAEPVAAMIQLQRLTGMRPGEVTIMRGCDFDTTGRLWVYTPQSHKTEHHGRKRVIYLGPKAQTVLKPLLKADLQAYLFSPADVTQQRRTTRHAQRQTPLSCGNRPGTNVKTRRRKEPGDRYTTQSYGRAIANGCDKAFPPPEELRRQRVPAHGRKVNTLRWETSQEWRDRLGEVGWASLKQWQRVHRWSPNQLRHNAATHLRKEFGIEAARVVLGHSSAVVTEVYAELDLAKAAEIMGRVG